MWMILLNIVSSGKSFRSLIRKSRLPIFINPYVAIGLQNRHMYPTEVKNSQCESNFHHVGNPKDVIEEDGEDPKKKIFKLNLGKAIDSLRKQLPTLFLESELDFSIFASTITVSDNNNSKLVVQKPFYMTAVKSLKMAASLSSIYPSLNLRKIEYVEDRQSIQCLVSIILPDSVRVEGQAVWQGIPPVSPSSKNYKLYPWLRGYGSWLPEPSLASNAPCILKVENSLCEYSNICQSRDGVSISR